MCIKSGINWLRITTKHIMIMVPISQCVSYAMLCILVFTAKWWKIQNVCFKDFLHSWPAWRISDEDFCWSRQRLFYFSSLELYIVHITLWAKCCGSDNYSHSIFLNFLYLAYIMAVDQVEFKYLRHSVIHTCVALLSEQITKAKPHNTPCIYTPFF